MSRARSRAGGDLALAACACAFGASFPLAKLALAGASPLVLVGVRFVAATLLLSPLLAWRRGRLAAGTVSWGLALGAVLAAGFALQTEGLTRIGAGRSAFLTALYVLVTPLVEWAWTGRRPASRTLLGAVVALGGVGVMVGPGTAGLGTGDLLTVLSAVAFALHISMLSRAVAGRPALPVVVAQLAACGAAASLAAPLLEAPRLEPEPAALAALAFLAVVSTALVLGLQAWGQARASPSRAALILASEPVWAALFGHALGERMTALEAAGAAVVLAGVVLGTAGRGAAQADSIGSSTTPR